MNIKEAVEKAEMDENVRRLSGYFLCSCFASINFGEKISEWTLLFYNPSRHTVADCLVNDRIVAVGEDTPAIKESTELDMDTVKLSADEAMNITKKSFRKAAINVLVSLHNKEIEKKNRAVWTIAYVMQDMSVTSFDINATNGKVLKEENTSLIRKV